MIYNSSSVSIEIFLEEKKEFHNLNLISNYNFQIKVYFIDFSFIFKDKIDKVISKEVSIIQKVKFNLKNRLVVIASIISLNKAKLLYHIKSRKLLRKILKRLKRIKIKIQKVNRRKIF